MRGMQRKCVKRGRGGLGGMTFLRVSFLAK